MFHGFSTITLHIHTYTYTLHIHTVSPQFFFMFPPKSQLNSLKKSRTKYNYNLLLPKKWITQQVLGYLWK